MPRVIWKGAISFGLVHVPVAMYPASEEIGRKKEQTKQERNAKQTDSNGEADAKKAQYRAGHERGSR